MSTTNEHSFWYGNIADDHNGHQGAGYSPEAAQEALEQAQRDDVPSAEYKGITGQIINNDKSL
jgi:RimJ/RimL family protein N-acetyltransferase